MTMTGFIDYTKPKNDQQRTASNVEPLPVTLSGSGGNAGAVWGPDEQGVATTKPSVQMGGVFNTVLPTVTNGQKVNWGFTARGEGLVAISNGALSAAIVSGNDDQPNASNGLVVYSRNTLYDGFFWDRSRLVTSANNTQAAGTASVDSPLWSTSDLLGNVINFNAAGDNTIIAGVASQTIRVHRMYFVAAGATNITIKDGAGTTLAGPMALAANGSITLDFSGRPWYKTSVANAFVINSSAAVQIGGRVEYAQSA